MRGISAFLGQLSLGLLAVQSGVAHHAPTEFEIEGSERLELKGTLVRVAWQNPHPFFEFRVPGSEGSDSVWHVEARGALSHLRRSGVSGELFEEGNSVTIAGVVSTRRERVMMGTHVLLSDGTEALLSAFDTPRWSENYIGGARGWEVDEERVQEAAGEEMGIFRVWSFPDRDLHGQAFAAVAGAITPSAYAIATTVEDYNRIAAECVPLSMPFVMMHPVNIEFVSGSDSIELRIGNFDAVRTIYLSGMSPDDDALQSPVGFSIGRWEDNELHIETQEIATRFASVIGMAQSENMWVSERFWLEDDQGILRYEMTMTDPEVFERTAVYSFHYVALGEVLGQFECRGD